jgi:hypothetical protein
MYPQSLPIEKVGRLCGYICVEVHILPSISVSTE